MTVLDRSAIIAPVRFQRWLIPPAALAIHLCIGQVYAFSVFKAPFQAHFAVGEVAVGWIFSLAIAMLGLSSAVMGTWVEKVGPRKAMVVAGCFWVAGFLISSLGISVGQLWLVYIGYGLIAGIGHAHEVVPGPPRPRHGSGDHGLRRRRAHREPRLEQAHGPVRRRPRA